MSQAPEPLTPHDCDLRGLPFMPLDVTRLLDSDFFALSSPEEFKAGVALWCKSWLQLPAASLPDDDRVLAHLSGAGVRWRKLKEGVLHGWVKCSDGRWYHPTVAEKAREAWKHRLSQRERAAKRWDKQRDDDGNATASLFDATASPAADAAAMQGTGTVKRKGEKSNPTQPIVDEHLRASLPEGFEQVVTAAGLRITAKNREREAAIVRDWVGIGLGLEEIVEEIRGFLAEHPGATSTLGRFDRRVRDRAARRACPRPAGQAAHALQPSGRDEFDDAPVIREALLSEFGEQTYASWLRPCGLSRDGDALIVKAQSRVAADWIRNHMIDRLRFASKAKRVEVVAA